MKLIGSICIIAACTYTGFFMGTLMHRRRVLLLQLRSCVLQLRASIRHERTPMPEALIDASRGKKGAVGDMFRSISRQMQEYAGVTTEEIWHANIDGFMTGSAITNEDMQSLFRLGSSIGSLDAELQDEVLSVYIDELGKSMELLSDEIRRKTGFYRMMGVLAGVFFTIVLL